MGHIGFPLQLLTTMSEDSSVEDDQIAEQFASTGIGPKRICEYAVQMEQSIRDLEAFGCTQDSLMMQQADDFPQLRHALQVNLFPPCL